MTVNRKLYPPRTIWQAMREERMKQVGYQCEFCGLPDASEFFNANKPHPFYPKGTPYRMYLQLAHKRQYETWNREAETLVLCPPCHGTFGLQNRRKRSTRYPSVIGLIVVWVWYRGEKCLAAEARHFDDLLEVIMSFADGQRFELEAEMLKHVVGKGRYCKAEGSVVVLRESGACANFGVLLQDILSGVVV